MFSTVLVPLLIVALLGWAALTNRKAVTESMSRLPLIMRKFANRVRYEMLSDKDAKFTVELVASGNPGGYWRPC